jgi:hypothetical protein
MNYLTSWLRQPTSQIDFKQIAADANRKVSVAELEKARRQREEIAQRLVKAADQGARSIEYASCADDIHPAVVKELTDAGYTLENKTISRDENVGGMQQSYMSNECVITLPPVARQ